MEETDMLSSVSLRRIAAVVVILGAVIVWNPIRGSAAAALERYTADAVQNAYPGRAGAAIVDMTIERWSSDAERDRLMSILIEDDQSKLLDALTKLPRVGFINTPGNLGYDLHYARKTMLSDGSARIVLATNRFISFWEATQQPRSVDYPFTLIELHVGPDGKGEGKISLATRIVYDKETKEATLENYQSQPVMLSNVRREDKKEDKK
jgi:hypothetical protein